MTQTETILAELQSLRERWMKRVNARASDGDYALQQNARFWVEQCALELDEAIDAVGIDPPGDRP